MEKSGAGCMTSEERVLAALDFRIPDRVPLYDAYWPEFVDAWRAEKRLPSDADIDDHYGNDVEIVIPAETPFPSQDALLESGAGYEIRRTGWGMVQRVNTGSKFFETLDVALGDKRDLEHLGFESPWLDTRYAPKDTVDSLKAKRCVFVKTGGPYLRTSNLRGTTQWLIDLAEDPAFARELAMRVTRHVTAVGLEAIKRYDVYHTGIWFFDDMSSNLSPMFSPQTFEQVFYPCYKWMCEQYRSAGVAHILLHCDGNITSILDMLVDAGIQGFHPVEPKAGMDVVDLRERYGQRLALLGGLDNAHILTRAPFAELRDHVLHVLEAGAQGGLVIGAHSIGPDVTVARYDYVREVIMQNGGYS